MELVDQVDELTTTHLAGPPLVKGFGEREERTMEFFLMGTHRRLTQGTLHSLWHFCHDRHPLLVTDNFARASSLG
jgi:hypothetical protein